MGANPLTRYRARVSAGGLLLMLLVSLMAPASHAADDACPSLQQLSTSARDQALLAAFLANAVTDSGRFRYKVDSTGRALEPSRYNVLRHAGAAFELARYLERRPDAPRWMRAALLRAMRYLRTCCIAALPERPDVLAVWSTAEVTGRDRPPVAKLGGAGLALAALAASARLVSEETDLELKRRLARFILYMQKPSGGFYSKHIPARGGRSDRWTSLYYPGEAALGLLMLYDLDPSREWLAGAARALHYLASQRRGAPTVPADHWALIATRKLMRSSLDFPELVDTAVLTTHAAQVARAMLDEAERSRLTIPGAFTVDGRTTPTATRVEGLAPAYPLLTRSEPVLAARIEAALDAAVEWLQGAIVREGPLVGAVPRAIAPLAPDGTPARERFNRRAGEIRIDYVQHVLGALASYRSVSRARGPCER